MRPCVKTAQPLRGLRWGSRTTRDPSPGRSLGQNQAVVHRFERSRQVAEVLLAAFDERRQLFDLGEPQRRLHIGGLQVVSDVRVSVFVIVAARQAAQLPLEALAAGIIFAGFAPAIAAPVAERLDENLQIGPLGELF